MKRGSRRRFSQSTGVALTLSLPLSACGGQDDNGRSTPELAATEPVDDDGDTSPVVLIAPSTAAPSPISLFPQEPAPVECSVTDEQSHDVLELLAPFMTLHDRFVRRTIFSWTVQEQVDELKVDPTLLTRSMSSDGQRGRAADLILEAAPTDPIAALLAEPRFEKKRFGWSNPWATLLGFTGEDYGDRLIAITLKEEAIVGKLFAGPAGLSWSFFDVNGDPLEEDYVLANSERIGAVYFVDERDPAVCFSSVSTAGSVMREYFVCNEAMIEGWSLDTDAIRAEVERAVVALQALHQLLQRRGCEPTESNICWRSRVIESWETAGEAATPLSAYENSLAFPNDLYLPRASNIANMVERLQAVPFADDPLIHANGE